MMSTQDQIRSLLKRLINHKGTLMRIFGITSSQLYCWIDGEPVSPDQATHLARVCDMVQRSASKHVRRCFDRYVTEPILAQTPALAEVLADPHFDEEVAMTLLTEAWRLSERREAKHIASEKRLAALGFKPLTDEQKRANAAYNQVMLDLQRGNR